MKTLAILILATSTLFATPTTSKETKKPVLNKSTASAPVAKEVPKEAPKETPKEAPKPADTFVPTNEEKLQLQVSQRDVVISQQQLQLLESQYRNAQSALQGAVQQYNGQVDVIRKAHNWGPEVVFDPQTQSFSKQK
jgi:hypothetical protein